ncbi:hypothetical protein H6F50_25490 [Coleofasciculus sp. FACHB-712]|uniref:hypothetical protein n=1 Tax=Cyanophyceae TaxID=3028117 RepID=UPI001684F690|nr:hypothetical protein [Coleofasciculus sp. FACHB-712]MBD1945665.1 hypothetical protein [Coleofasciculus sp. FACHB-712]
MNKPTIFFTTLFRVLLLGCTNPRETLPQPTAAKLLEAQSTEPLTPKEADALISSTINAIKQKNATFFIPYLLERDRNIENVQAALSHYETYF